MFNSQEYRKSQSTSIKKNLICEDRRWHVIIHKPAIPALPREITNFISPGPSTHPLIYAFTQKAWASAYTWLKPIFRLTAVRRTPKALSGSPQLSILKHSVNPDCSGIHSNKYPPRLPIKKLHSSTFRRLSSVVCRLSSVI